MSSGEITVYNCDFYGTTSLKKTGGVNNLNSGNMFRGPTTIENASSGNYLYWGYNTPDTFLNALTLINRSSQALWMNYTSTGQYGGDITLDGDSLKVIRFGSSTAGRVAVFNGSTDQTLNVLNPNLNVQAYRLEVNKSAGRLKVTSDMVVSYELRLTDGIIETLNGAVITLNDGVAPTATDSSYVEGKVKKIGNDAFTFPIGTNGHYRPIGISAPGSTSDAFTAEHRNEDSNDTYAHSNKDSTINEISTNEYWTLDRTAGTSDITVTLSWDAMSCGFDTLANLRMVAWDTASTAKWKDLGNGGITGDSLVGTINSSGVSTVYGAFSLATVDTFACYGSASCYEQPIQLGEKDTCLMAQKANGGQGTWYRFKATSPSVTLSMLRTHGDNILIGKFAGLFTQCGSDTIVGKTLITDSLSSVIQFNQLTKDEYYYINIMRIQGVYEDSISYTLCIQNNLDIPFEDYAFAFSGGSQSADCNKSSQAYEDYYGQLSSYIPSGTTVPLKTIKVNFNIFQDGNGTGNFQSFAQDGGIDEENLNQIFNWLRDHYWSMDDPSDITISVASFSDSKIRFELNDIYFYNNSSVYYSTSSSVLLNEVANGVDGDPERLDALNICFNGACYNKRVGSVTITSGGTGYGVPPTVVFSPALGGINGTAIISNGSVIGVSIEDDEGGSYSGDPNQFISISFVSNDGGTGATATVDPLIGGATAFADLPSYTNLNIDQAIVMLNWTSNPNPIGFYATASNMAHEVGHTLGLLHTYTGGGTIANCTSLTDYLSDIYGPFPPGVNCPHSSAWAASSLTNTPPKITNNIMGGNQTGRYLSPLQLGWIHRTLSLGSTRKYVMETPFDITPREITTDETWDFDIRWYSDIIVKNGATLTITCKVLMADQAKIVVERGGRLVVDHGIITSAYKMWQGIEVWGDPDAAPDATLPSAQGILELSNGAIIENAVVGVDMIKKPNCCSHSGGIIRSIGGSAPTDRVLFRNNRKHVAFGPLDQTSLSRFDNTDFLCDGPMQDLEAYNGLGSQQYVSIWAQDGIVFNNCTFENTITYLDASGQEQTFPENLRGGGIRAIDAKVYVEGDAPVNENYNSRFTGMIWGVMVLRTIGSAAEVNVENTLFDNNGDFGLLSEGSEMDRISNCKFIIPEPQEAQYAGIRGIGIHMLDNGGHIVNNNKFEAVNGQEPNFGYICNGSTDPLANTGGLLWDNNFDGIKVATQTENYNQSLELRCNTYEAGNALDWAINPESENMILGPQGTGCEELLDYRAGNVFNDGLNDHIRSWAQQFSYFYEMSGNQEPDVSQSPNAITVQDCLPVGGGDPSCTEQPFIMAPNNENAFQRLAQQDSLLAVLYDEMDTIKVYLDSTNTDTLLAHIADTNYSNVTLKSELLQYSFLSDTVLNASCTRSPFFTNAQFQDIIVNNSPVTGRVWPFLSDALNGIDKKESAYVDTMLSAQQTDSLRTPGFLEKEIRQADKTRFWAIKEMVQHYAKFDTVPDSTYAMIHFLADTLPDRQWNRLAVGVALDVDTLSWARSILDSLPKLTADDSIFYDYHDLAITLAEDTLTWFGMDSTQNALVNTVAAGNSSVRYRAQAVQALLGDSTMVRLPEQLPYTPSFRLAEDEQNTDVTVSNSKVNIYPNPFNNEFTVSYALPDTVDRMVFEVFDLTGRVILRKDIGNASAGSTVLNIGQCKGFYLLRVTGDDRTLRTVKLICTGQ